MTTESESEGQGASEMESDLPLSLCPHTLPGTSCSGPAPQTEVLLLFRGAGNVDSGHVLRKAPAS